MLSFCTQIAAPVPGDALGERSDLSGRADAGDGTTPEGAYAPLPVLARSSHASSRFFSGLAYPVRPNRRFVRNPFTCPLRFAKSGVFSDIGASFYEPAAGSSISGFGGQSVMRLRPEALLACHDVVCGIFGPASVAMTAKLLCGVLFKTHHRSQNISVRTMKRQWAKCDSVHKFSAEAARPRQNPSTYSCEPLISRDRPKTVFQNQPYLAPPRFSPSTFEPVRPLPRHDQTMAGSIPWQSHRRTSRRTAALRHHGSIRPLRTRQWHHSANARPRTGRS